MIDIFKFFKKKEEVPDYPDEFLEIDFSIVAKKNGLKDDLNKVIKYHFINLRGFKEIKFYRYSQVTLKSLMKTYEIPVLDRTRMEEGFPVYGEVDLSDVSYTK